MIWVAWRQQRTEALIAALLVALAAAVIVPTGLHMASVYDQEGIAACLGEPTGACREKLDAFAGRWGSLTNLVVWFNLVPGLLGILLAAPFVLEFERGTFRLAWTQSITSGRWLAARLGLIAVAAVAVSVLFSLLVTWWRGTLDDVDGRMVEGFSVEGVVPIAYTLFAAALVVAIGVVLRRTAAAIGLALVLFFVARIAIENSARPHYATKLEGSWVEGTEPDLRGAWVFSQGGEFRIADGQVPDPGVVQGCITSVSGKSYDAACLGEHGIVPYTHAVYHPASRFWLFQGIEAGIFVALTLPLVGFSVWWIRKRIS